MTVRFIPRPIIPKAPILIVPKERIIGVNRECEILYITRITETTILSFDSDLHETLWRRDNGRLKKHISLTTDWYIPEHSLDQLEMYLEQHSKHQRVGRPIYNSGFRPRFNDKGIEVYDTPPMHDTPCEYLKSLGFTFVEVSA